MVLIAEIGSTSTRDDHVDSILKALLIHYCQPIHVVEEVLPYFHDKSDPDISSVLSHWISGVEGRDWTTLLDRYAATIRPKLIVDSKISQAGIPVLQHYEVLVSELRKKDTSRPIAVNPLTLSTLCSDITLLTRAPAEDDISKAAKARFIRSNIVLPTLLRLLQHAFSSFTNSDPLAPVAICTLLPFSKSKLDPRLLLKELETRNSLILDCSVPCPSSESVQMIEWLDYEKAELNGSDWNDPRTNLSATIANECWNELGGNVSSICESVGWKKSAAAVRAHFFGRATEEIVPTPARPLRYPLKLQGTKPSEPAYRSTPSRINTALQFISLLPSVSHEILGDLLPVCYSLMDSHFTSHVSIGACTLTRLIQLSTSNDLLEFEDGLLSVLELSLRVSRREGPSLGLVGLSFSTAFMKLPHRTRERRMATATLLSIVERNQYAQSDDDGFLLSVVMGGVIPLLKQHAELPNADALEMGRAGLRTLLPLLRWDCGLNGKKLQAASLVALINLFVGAYPIMPGHGGKITSELLACWGHAKREHGRLRNAEIDLCNLVMVLTKHATVVALLICQGIRAEEVLHRVETEDYDEGMKRHVLSVRELVANWKLCPEERERDS